MINLGLFRALGGTAAAMAAISCSAAEDVSVGTSTAALAELASSDADELAEVPPKTLVDPKGGVWVRGDEPAKVHTAEEEAAIWAARREAEAEQALLPPEPIEEEPDIKSLSIEAIAEMIRGKRLIHGYEYVSEPDLELARRVKEGEFDNIVTEVGYGVLGKPDGPPEEQLEGMQIIGGDGRSHAGNNTSFPHRTQIVLSNTAGGGHQCSATLVGDSTALTVAHCVHSGTGFYSTRGWGPGVDASDNTPFRFDPTPNPGDNYPHSTAERIQGCLSVTVPNGFDGDGNSSTDYAVIEFDIGWWAGGPCGEPAGQFNDQPGATVGHLSIQTNVSDSIMDNNHMYIYGYPAEQNCTGGCDWPSIWGHGVQSSDSDAGTWSIKYKTDANGGQSGSGVYYFDPAGNRRVVGVHMGGRTEHHCQVWPFCWTEEFNRGRRIDSVYWSFIQSNSEL